MLRCWWTFTRIMARQSGVHRTRRNSVIPQLESLGERIAPAVTASFKASAGELVVRGDKLNNNIVVSRSNAGVIFVNGRRVAAPGGFLTVAKTKSIVVNGLAGNDLIFMSSTKGGLPNSSLIGGAGNDVLIGSVRNDDLLGGAGNDFLHGGRGIDALSGGIGDDQLIWNNGDSRDYLVGDFGDDMARINGASASDSYHVRPLAIADRIDISILGQNLDVMVSTMETVDLNPLSGSVNAEIKNLAGTGLRTLNINLAGDGAAARVTVEGTEGNDDIHAEGINGRVEITNPWQPAPQVNISNATPANAELLIRGLGGSFDSLWGVNLAALVQLTIDGGDGDDEIHGSDGADSLHGGAGNDYVYGGPGNDSVGLSDGDDVYNWSAGDGRDLIFGGDGNDLVIVNGTDADDTIQVFSGIQNSLNIAVGHEQVFVVEAERSWIYGAAGSDSFRIEDFRGTDATTVEIFPGDIFPGNTDGAVDEIIVNGVPAVDNVFINGSGNEVAVYREPSFVYIRRCEPGIDTLTVNTFAGADTVTAVNVANNTIHVTINGGDDADTVVGGQGNDTINGDAGDDDLNGGDGDDLLDGGDGNDTIDGGLGDDTAVNGEVVTNVP